MKKNETSAKEAAKVGLCAGVAGVTALSGVAPALAFADAPQPSHVDVIRATEDASLTVDQAKQALDSANAQVDATAAARDAAQVKLDDATSSRDDLATVVSEAKRTALDDQLALSAAIDSVATSAGDALGFANETANAANAQLDEAMKIRDAAKAELDRAQAALQEAQSAYDAAAASPSLGDSTETASAVEVAESELNDAVGKRDELNTLVQSARLDLDAKTQAHATAQANLNQAQSKRAEAASQLESAQSLLSNAQTQKHDLEEENASLDGQITSAQAQIESARVALTQANSEVSTAQSAFDLADAELKAAQTAHQNALCQLNADVAAYETARNNAQTALNGAIADATDAGVQLNSAKLKLDELKDALDTAENEYQVAQQAFNQAQANFTEAEARFKSIDSTIVDTRDYFTNQIFGAGDEFSSKREVDGVEHPEVVAATRPKTSGDATDPKSIEEVIKYIRSLNDCRKEAGLQELLVLDSLMAREIVNINWSATTREHAPGCGNEDLSWGYSNPLDKWYWAPSKTYNSVAAMDNPSYNGIALPSDWQTMSASELKGVNPEFYDEISPYLNCMHPGKVFIGAAVNTSAAADGGVTWGQVFSLDNPLNEPALTIDEWETCFVSWMSGVSNDSNDSSDSNESIRQAYEDATTALETARDTRNDAVEKRNSAESAYVQQRDITVPAAQAYLVQTNATRDTLQKAFEDAEVAYENALTSSNNAQADIDAAKRRLDAAQLVWDGASTTLTTKKAAAEDAKNDFSAAMSLSKRLKDKQAENEGIIKGCETTIEQNSAIVSELEASLKTQDAEIADLNAIASQLARDQLAMKERSDGYETNYALAQSEVFTANAAFEAAQQAHQDRLDANAALVTTTANLTTAGETVEAKKIVLLIAGDEVLRAEEDVNTAREALSEATLAFKLTDGMTVEQALAQDLDDPALAGIKEAVERLNQSLKAAEEAADALEAAEADLDEAEDAYQAAHEEWASALAAAADAQVVYDNLLASQSVNVEQPPATTPSTPSNESQQPSGNNPAQSAQTTPSTPEASGPQQSGPATQSPAGDQQQSQPTIADVANEPGPSGSGSVVSYQQPAAPAAASYSNGSASAYPRFAVSTPVDEVEAVYDEPIVDEAQALVEESIADDGTPLAIPIAEEDNSVAGIAGGVSIAVVVGAGAAVASMKLRRRRNNS